MTRNNKKRSVLDGDLINIHADFNKRKPRMPQISGLKEMHDINFIQKYGESYIEVEYTYKNKDKKGSISYKNMPDFHRVISAESRMLVSDYIDEFEKINTTRAVIESFKKFRELKPSEKINLITSSTIMAAVFSATEIVTWMSTPVLLIGVNSLLIGAGIYEAFKQNNYRKYRLANEHFEETAMVINEGRPEDERVDAVYGLIDIPYFKLKKEVQKKLKR